MAADIYREKLQLIEWIVKQEKMASLKLLSEIMAGMDRAAEDEGRVVGYRARGLRVTRSQLVDVLHKALADLDKSKLVSLETLEQESDKW